MAARKPRAEKPDAAPEQHSEPTQDVELDPTVRHEPVALEDDQGFIGVKVDPYPNEAYSLESGPSSPGVVEAHAARDAQPQE